MLAPTKGSRAHKRLLAAAILGCFAVQCRAGGVAYPLYINIPEGGGASAGIHAITMDGQGNIQGSNIQYPGSTAEESLFLLNSSNVYTNRFQFDPLVTSKLHPSGVNTDGAGVNSVVVAADGTLYGSAFGGGKSGAGTAIKLTSDGQFSVLYTFGKRADGSQPNCIVAGTDGNFYGTTQSGGSGGFGTVFQLSPDGKLTTLYSFPHVRTRAGAPEIPRIACPAIGSDGNIYGVQSLAQQATSDPNTVDDDTVIYKVTPSGTYSVVTTFQLQISGGKGVSVTGSQPGTRLTLGSDGALYGILAINGNESSTLFRVNQDGTVDKKVTGLPSGLGTQMGLPLLAGQNGAFYGAGGNWNALFSASASSGTNPAMYTFADTTWGGDSTVDPNSLYFDGYGPSAWTLDDNGNLIVATAGFNSTASIIRIVPNGDMNVSLSDGGVVDGMTNGQVLNLSWSATGASQCAFVGTPPTTNSGFLGSQPFTGQMTLTVTNFPDGEANWEAWALQCSDGQGGLARSLNVLIF